MDPFPGNIGQIYLAKIHNKTPEIPPEFPAALKELVSTGWGIKPEDRPELEKFRSVFCLILKQEEEKILTGNNKAKMQRPSSRTNRPSCLADFIQTFRKYQSF